jgi:exopolysaccharide/PEP-CTERM locus tyrosine autokinase
MSLVEQTIARLKKQQGTASSRLLPDRSPHGMAPGSPADSMDPTDTASLAKQIPVDYAALRARGYFPERDIDRQFADQYRRIKRTLVDKALAGSAAVGEPRVIMVTSALSGDGKTFTSINLALSMALERDVSVLLVDADVAKRHVTDIFGLGDREGLLDVLLDERLELDSAIVPTAHRGLSILPTGKQSAGAAELLSSSRMRKLIGNLCTRNPRRIVLMDSPPLLITNEGRVLIKLAGQVVLVVRAGETPKPAVQAAIAMLDAQQAGGVVLNQVAAAGEDYYAYGSYGTDGAAT